MKKTIIRITSVPISLKVLLKGQLKFINSTDSFEVIGISSPGKELEEVAIYEEISCYSVPMKRNISLISDLSAVIRLYFLLRKLRPHIVHTHTPKAGTLGMVAAYLAGVPHRFHTVAGLPLMEKSGILRSLLILVEKLTYSFSSMVLPNSFGLKDFILKNKLVSEEKLKVLGHGSSNGINLLQYSINSELDSSATKIKSLLGIKDTDIVFLFVGRIVSHKGINELLYAFNELNKDFADTKLLIVGNFEPHLDPVNRTSLNLLKAENVIHIGYQSDVRPYFIMSDVFVFPSYREGFPNVVLQACAYNLPCIVTDINGCNEIIEDGIDGFIIPKKDHNCLYYAMKKFVLNSDLIVELGKNSRERIKLKYSQDYVWNEILSLYESTL